MTLYTALLVVCFSYTAFVVCVTIFTGYFQFKYLKSPIEANYRMALILDRIRGRWTILLPLKIFSIVFLISWLVLAMPWFDLFLGTHIATKPMANIFEPWQTWVGTFKDKEGDKYFFYIFVNVLGVKGFHLISHLTKILSDESLEVGRYGNVRYKSRL